MCICIFLNKNKQESHNSDDTHHFSLTFPELNNSPTFEVRENPEIVVKIRTSEGRLRSLDQTEANRYSTAMVKWGVIQERDKRKWFRCGQEIRDKRRIPWVLLRKLCRLLPYLSVRCWPFPSDVSSVGDYSLAAAQSRLQSNEARPVQQRHPLDRIKTSTHLTVHDQDLKWDGMLYQLFTGCIETIPRLPFWETPYR